MSVLKFEKTYFEKMMWDFKLLICNKIPHYQHFTPQNFP
jgi:hypothetical protein